MWGSENSKQAPAEGVPPKGETLKSFLEDKELFGVPKAAVWRTKKQPTQFLKEKKKEKEAREEDEGDGQDKDTDNEDRDGDGDGSGGA